MIMLILKYNIKLHVDSCLKQTLSSLTGMYFASSMILVSMSCMMTVVVLNIHYRGTTGYNLPPWVRKLFLEKLGRFLCSNRTKYTIQQQGVDHNKIAPEKFEKFEKKVFTNVNVYFYIQIILLFNNVHVQFNFCYLLHIRSIYNYKSSILTIIHIIYVSPFIVKH